MLNCNSVYNCR